MDDRTHQVLLALAGRIDDDLLAWCRELVAVGEDGRALELITATLVADGTALPPQDRSALVDAARSARTDLDADAVLRPGGATDATPHRFDAGRGVEDLAAAVGALPERLVAGCRTWVTFRSTPAGSAPGPLPQPVVLVEVAPDDPRPLDVLAYQLATACARVGAPSAAVEVVVAGSARPEYQQAAVENALPVHGADSAPRTDPYGTAVYRPDPWDAPDDTDSFAVQEPAPPVEDPPAPEEEQAAAWPALGSLVMPPEPRPVARRSPFPDSPPAASPPSDFPPFDDGAPEPDPADTAPDDDRGSTEPTGGPDPFGSAHGGHPDGPTDVDGSTDDLRPDGPTDEPGDLRADAAGSADEPGPVEADGSSDDPGAGGPTGGLRPFGSSVASGPLDWTPGTDLLATAAEDAPTDETPAERSVFGEPASARDTEAPSAAVTPLRARTEPPRPRPTAVPPLPRPTPMPGPTPLGRRRPLAPVGDTPVREASVRSLPTPSADADTPALASIGDPFGGPIEERTSTPPSAGREPAIDEADPLGLGRLPVEPLPDEDDFPIELPDSSAPDSWLADWISGDWAMSRSASSPDALGPDSPADHARHPDSDPPDPAPRPSDAFGGPAGDGPAPGPSEPADPRPDRSRFDDPVPDRSPFDDPLPDRSPFDDPLPDRSPFDDPLPDRSPSDDPLPDRSPSDHPMSDYATSDGPLSDGPLSDGPLSGGPLSGGPLSDRPLSDRAPAEGSLADGSPSGRSAPDQPLPERRGHGRPFPVRSVPFAPGPAEPPTDQAAPVRRPAPRPAPQPETPMEQTSFVLPPESVARLSDADRELLARLQSELGDTPRPRVTRRAGIGGNGTPGPNGRGPHPSSPPDMAG